MSSYMRKTDAGSQKIICKNYGSLDSNIQSSIFPFCAGQFAKNAAWLSATSSTSMLRDENLWSIATEDDTIRASLYVDRKLSDGGMICTIKCLVSDGSIPGIGKCLIAVASREIMESTALPVSFNAYLRVLNGRHNVPSMMAFNKNGFVSMVSPERVPIDPCDIHLARDEFVSDGCFDVQKLEASPKQIFEHSEWVLRDWEKV